MEKYYCEPCNRYFPKEAWLQNHLKGKPHAKVVADLAKKEAEAAGKQPTVAVASQKEVPDYAKGLVSQQSEEDWLSPLFGLAPYKEEKEKKTEETPLEEVPGGKRKLEEKPQLGKKKKVEEQAMVCCVTENVWGKLVIPCTVSFKNM